MRLSVHTQTPFLRFLRPVPETRRRLDLLVEGEDHLPSPGGVTRMLRALLRRFAQTKRIDSATWMSLSSGGPSWLDLDDHVRIEHVRLDPAAQAQYVAAKGAVWNAIHGIPVEGEPDIDRGLGHLADAMGRRATKLHALDPYDAFYVHDFQLLPLARKLPAEVPRAFRWHIPVELPASIRKDVVRALDQYDSVVVSTHAYADALRDAGVSVPVHASYPYVDDTRLPVLAHSEVDAFAARWGIEEDDVVFTLVARLDPMKSQDVAIRALAAVRDALPRAKLLLVGGGGFSAGRQGLGMDYAAGWRHHLETLEADLGVADRVIFTGGIPDEELELAFARARAVLLPSALEGFGLVAVEAWLRGKPVIVSRGAGVSELVDHGGNGYVHAPGDVDGLAAGLLALGRDADAAARMGADGRMAARACSLRRRADDVWSILTETVETCARC